MHERCLTTNRVRTVAASFSLIVATACSQDPESGALPPGPSDPATSLATLESFAARAEREALRAAWDGDEPARFGLIPLLTLRPKEIEALRSGLSTDDERRRLSLLEDRVIRMQLGADRQVALALNRLGAVRARRALGDQVALERALTELADPEARRAAWMTQADAAREMAPLLRDAWRARAAWARARQGEDLLLLLGRHRGYDPVTAERIRRQVGEALAVAPGEPLLDPWDTEAADPALVSRLKVALDAEHCARRAREMLLLVGLPETPPELSLDFTPDAQDFADFASYAVDPPRDVRVRLAPVAGLFAHWASLHEMGHAAQGLLAPAHPASPLLSRPASDAVSESCAKVFERLAYAPEWLVAQRVPDADIAALATWERASERMRVRGILCDTDLEDVLQENMDGDIDAIHARLLASVAGVRAVPGVPAWALHRTVAFEPRGRFDYLLARCAQAAIYRRLRALPGGLLGEEARRVLREDVLASATGARYEDWFERASGVAPSCDAWLEDVAGMPR